jgi:hypothetical protein
MVSFSIVVGGSVLVIMQSLMRGASQLSKNEQHTAERKSSTQHK